MQQKAHQIHPIAISTNICTQNHSTSNIYFFCILLSLSRQWIPLPLFLVYRVLLTIYVFIWLILHVVERTYGPRWLIYLSDLGYTLLFISSGLAALLCLVYTIIHYTKPSKLQKYFPHQDVTSKIYEQDNIPWCVKLVWALYIISKCISALIFFGYWLLIYSPCSDQQMSQPKQNGSVVTGQEGNSSCSAIDIYTIQIHGVTLLIVFLDMFLSRIPYQLFHIFYPMIFTLLYVLFTIIYWAAGGTDNYNNSYVYSVLNYDFSISFLYGFLLIPAPILIYFFIFLLAWLRDVLYRRISCCFRDIKAFPFHEQVSNKDTVTPNKEIHEEEVQEEETTKV